MNKPYLISTLSAKGIFQKASPTHVNNTKRQIRRILPPSEISNLSPTRVLSVWLLANLFQSNLKTRVGSTHPLVFIGRRTCQRKFICYQRVVCLSVACCATILSGSGWLSGFGQTSQLLDQKLGVLKTELSLDYMQVSSNDQEMV